MLAGGTLGRGAGANSRRAPLAPGFQQAPAAAPDARAETLDRWCGWAAARLGLEAEAVEVPLPHTARMLGGTGPALLRLPELGGGRLLFIVGARSGQLHLLAPTWQCTAAVPACCATPCAAPWEQSLAREVERLLDTARAPPRRRARVGAALLAERLAQQPVGSCWMVRLPAAGGWWRQIGQLRVGRRVGAMLALSVVLYGAELLGWSLIGNAALNGHVDRGWLAAWLLLVLSMVPLRLAGAWIDAGIALDAGQALKRRLLAGALAGDSQQLRRQGVGHLLSRVMEAQALESFALDGGLSLLVTLVEFGFAGWLLAAGAGGLPHLALLLLWLGVAGVLGWRFGTRLQAWTGQRLDMTHDLVERMVGHRTCLAQEEPQRRAARHEATPRGYLQAARAANRVVMPFGALVLAGWLVVGLAGLVPAFVAGSDGTVSSGLVAGFGVVLPAKHII